MAEQQAEMVITIDLSTGVSREHHYHLGLGTDRLPQTIREIFGGFLEGGARTIIMDNPTSIYNPTHIVHIGLEFRGSEQDREQGEEITRQVLGFLRERD